MAEKESFDVTEHELVPEHEVLPEEEAEELMEEYDIEPHQLPKIDSKDPVAKAIGAKAGDIVKIARDSSTAGETAAYRLVV